MARCEATNEAGARCLYGVHAGTFHFYADSAGRDSFDLGRLSQAVRDFLDEVPVVDRDFLARVLAETEAER